MMNFIVVVISTLIVLDVVVASPLLFNKTPTNVNTVKRQEPMQLNFRADGTFVIMQFADTQYSTAASPCVNINPDQLPCNGKNTTDMMRRLIDQVNPDLVVLTGDNLTGGANNQSYLDIISPMIDSNTPWAAVFGNHDEDSPIMSKEIVRDIEYSYRPLSQFQEGPTDIHGLGNYLIPIYRNGSSSAVGFHLWMLDSGAYDLTGEIGGYDWIHADQIAWYVETKRTVTQNIPAMAFFHIPLQEWEIAYRNGDCFGNSYEGVYDANINSGFFAAAKDGGDIIGMFVGHDHVNDYICDHYGIYLAYGRGSGWTTYGRAGFLRGARVIVVKEFDYSFDTYLVLSDGSIVNQPTNF